MKFETRVVCNIKKQEWLDNGIISLHFLLPAEERENYIKIHGMQNENITLYVQAPPEEELNLGEYMLKAFNVDGDGEVKMKLVTPIECAEMDNIIKTEYIDRGTDIVLRMCVDIEEDEESISDDGQEDWGADDNNDYDDYVDDDDDQEW